MWILWLLYDPEHPERPSRAFPEKQLLFIRIQNAIHAKLANLGADPRAKDSLRLARVARQTIGDWLNVTPDEAEQLGKIPPARQFSLQEPATDSGPSRGATRALVKQQRREIIARTGAAARADLRVPTGRTGQHPHEDRLGGEFSATPTARHQAFVVHSFLPLPHRPCPGTAALDGVSAWPRPALVSVLLCRLPQPDSALRVRSLRSPESSRSPPTKALRLDAALLGAAPLAFWCPGQETEAEGENDV